MLRAIPNSWFSWDFTIYDDNTPLTKIDMAWIREAGEFTLNGSTYKVYRDGMFSGAFMLESEGQVLARAEKPSFLFRSFDVTYEGETYTLETKSSFQRGFVLRQGQQRIGTLEPENLFSRTVTVELPKYIDLPVRIFMVWLMMIIWKRDADSG